MTKNNIRKKFILSALLGLAFAILPVSLAQAAGVEFDGFTATLGYSNPIDITGLTTEGGKSYLEVKALPEGAVVKVYDNDSKVLGSSTVKTGESSALVGLSNLDNGVWVTVTMESDKSLITVTPTTSPSGILVANNVGIADTVTVPDLAGGDIVRVYDAATGGNVLGTATVGKGKVEAVVSIKQLGDTGGKVFVSLKTAGQTESARVEKDYSEEPQTYKLAQHNITIKNNAGLPDTVTVTDLVFGDIIKVYDPTTSKLLGTAKVAKDKDLAIVSIKKLETASGNVTVTVTSLGERESDPFPTGQYAPETQTGILEESKVEIINNVGTADSVTVTDLLEGDIVKVYADTKLLGTAKAAKGKAVVSIKQLETDASTTVSVTVTSIGKTESPSINKGYDKELTTDILEESKIEVINNVGTADKVTVTGLKDGDIVKVYAGTKLLGTATVAKGKTDAVVSISQLGTEPGTINVSLTSKGYRESAKLEKNYAEEAQSSAPNDTDIVVNNNSDANDTVKVEKGLGVGDIVKVYKTSNGGTLWGKATVVSGESAVVTIRQFGLVGGSVWVTVTSVGKLESTRIMQTYEAE